MNNSHESFLVPFFKEMNSKFQDQWCVLHSYETLPYYSISDVDMAFSGTNIHSLELIIKRIALDTKWVLLQKLWYDVQNCYYYVLRHAESDTLLAIDFLIDNDGIGKYGFTTKTLTQDCVLTNASFPIPNPETALCYKLVKRIVKKRSLEADEAYLVAQYKTADRNRVSQILAQQFGEEGKEPILGYLGNQKKTLGTKDIILLNSIRKKAISTFGKRLKYGFWELKRLINRVLFPCGIHISVPEMSKEQLTIFTKTLQGKVGILFRFVRLNISHSKMTNLKGFVGSTLVISPGRISKPQNVITPTWGSKKSVEIDSIAWATDPEGLANQYFIAIVEALAERMQNNRMANGS